MTKETEIDLMQIILDQQHTIDMLKNQQSINTSHIHMLKVEVDRLRTDNIFYEYNGQRSTRQKIEKFDNILDDLQHSNVSNLVNALSILIPCIADKILDDSDKNEIMSKLIHDLYGSQSYFKIDVRSNTPPKDNEAVVRLISSILNVPVDSMLALYR